MSVLVAIIIFTLLGGLLSVLAASLILLLPDHHYPRMLPHGVSFAIGALLSAAFWGLLPHAIEEAGSDHARPLFLTVLAGILLFFTLEKLLLWRHCHESHCETHLEDHYHQPAGTLIVLGDTIHNFVDGVLIGATFLTDIHLGIVTSLAVAAHEIPQEIGDFIILLQSGYSRIRALLFNILSSLATVVGGILAYLSLGKLHDSLPYFLALAASSFIYVAVADLIPSLHRRTAASASIQQIAMILAGVLLIGSAHEWAHHTETQLEQPLHPH